MARNEVEERVRLLKSLAFRIHKKEAAADALAECFEAEGRGGRHRQWRDAGAVLAAEGFVPALLAGGLVGDEVAAILTVVEKAKDHRLLSDVLDALVEHVERQD